MTRLNGALLHTARHYVRCPHAAADVVQETWVGFLLSIERFEGRCSVKTWLFRILFNKAKTRAAKDQRLVPFSTMAARECGSSDEAITTPGASEPCSGWGSDPAGLLNDKETLEAVHEAIALLPPAQGTVMLMRDIEGMSSSEVCNALDLTATNQRVLLHRARTKVRRTLAARFAARGTPAEPHYLIRKAS